MPKRVVPLFGMGTGVLKPMENNAPALSLSIGWNFAVVFASAHEWPIHEAARGL